MEPNAAGCEVTKATVDLINDYYKADSGGSHLSHQLVSLNVKPIVEQFSTHFSGLI